MKMNIIQAFIWPHKKENWVPVILVPGLLCLGYYILYFSLSFFRIAVVLIMGPDALESGIGSGLELLMELIVF